MKHGLLKGTNTSKLKFSEYCIIGKKTRVKFGNAKHDTRNILEYHDTRDILKYLDTRDILKYVHSDVWGPTKIALISRIDYFIYHLMMISPDVCGYTACEQRIRFYRFS